MSNCIPCSPCNNNCPDDGEIIETTILDADDCGGCGSCGGCKDNCGINIQSTNDCLTVDTSECGVIKLTAECPKPTYVKAGANVTVRDVTPPSDCYIDGGDCGTEGGWEVSSTDEKVKACSGDSTSGYLYDKLEAGTGIKISKVGCDGTDSKVKITLDKDELPECPDIPDITIDCDSEIIQATPNGHHITITDVTNKFYSNMCSIGFIAGQEYTVELDEYGRQKGGANLKKPIREVCTGNPEMATANGIVIKESGHYRIYGQLTVQNNLRDTDRYINLGRGFLEINNDSPTVRPVFENFYLSTAKHGEYNIAFQLQGGTGIKIDNDGVISVSGGSVTIPEGGGTRNVSYGESQSQVLSGNNGPWMTFNMECQIDLYEGDTLTLVYRCQSDMPSSKNKTTSFMYVGANDTSIGRDVNTALFGGTVLSVQMISPLLLQKNASNRTRQKIQ